MPPFRRLLKTQGRRKLQKPIPIKGLRRNNFTFRRERRAGICKAPRRRRCGDIVEERQRSRCPPAAAPLWAAARRLAGCVARSLHATRLARRSRLASEPGGQQQSANIILGRFITTVSGLTMASTLLHPAQSRRSKTQNNLSRIRS